MTGSKADALARWRACTSSSASGPCGPSSLASRQHPPFSADGNTISGAWEKRFTSGDWEHDFALTYRRAG